MYVAKLSGKSWYRRKSNVYDVRKYVRWNWIVFRNDKTVRIYRILWKGLIRLKRIQVLYLNGRRDKIRIDVSFTCCQNSKIRNSLSSFNLRKLRLSAAINFSRKFVCCPKKTFTILSLQINTDPVYYLLYLFIFRKKCTFLTFPIESFRSFLKVPNEFIGIFAYPIIRASNVFYFSTKLFDSVFDNGIELLRRWRNVVTYINLYILYIQNFCVRRLHNVSCTF